MHPLPSILTALSLIAAPQALAQSPASAASAARPETLVPLTATLKQIVPRLDPAATITTTAERVVVRFPAARRTVTLNLKTRQAQIQDQELGIASLQVQQQGGQTLVQIGELLNALGLGTRTTAQSSSLAYTLPGQGAGTYAQGVRQEWQLAHARRATLALPRARAAGVNWHPLSPQYTYLFPAGEHARFFRVDFNERYAQFCQLQGKAVRCMWEAALSRDWTARKNPQDRVAAFLGSVRSERGVRPTVSGAVDAFEFSNSGGTVYVHVGTLDAQGKERRQRTYVLERTDQRAFPVISAP